jgi:hypothetical protein
MERRELVHGCSHGFYRLRWLWLCRTGIPYSHRERAYHVSKGESDRLADLEATVEDVRATVVALSSVVARILKHLDPHQTSQTLKPSDGEE